MGPPLLLLLLKMLRAPACWGEELSSRFLRIGDVGPNGPAGPAVSLRSESPSPLPQGHPGGPPGVIMLPKYDFSGEHQSAKISQCCVPIRSYMVSNCTLEWSGGDAQPPESSVVHLGPSVAGLGADFGTTIWPALEPSMVALGPTLNAPFGVSK